MQTVVPVTLSQVDLSLVKPAKVAWTSTPGGVSTTTFPSKLTFEECERLGEGDVGLNFSLYESGHVKALWVARGRLHVAETMYRSGAIVTQSDAKHATMPIRDRVVKLAVTKGDVFSEAVSDQLLCLMYRILQPGKREQLEFPEAKSGHLMRTARKAIRLGFRGTTSAGVESSLLKYLWVFHSDHSDTARVKLHLMCSHFTYLCWQCAAAMAISELGDATTRIRFQDAARKPLSFDEFKRENAAALKQVVRKLPVGLRENAGWVGPRDMYRLLIGKID